MGTKSTAHLWATIIFSPHVLSPILNEPAIAVARLQAADQAGGHDPGMKKFFNRIMRDHEQCFLQVA